MPREQLEQWEYGTTAVYGPLTKTVEDAALVLDQVVGASELDPTSLPHPGLSYLDKVREPLPAGLRIGFSPDLGYAVVQSDVAAAVEDATRVFARLGHRVEPHRGRSARGGPAWGLLGAFLHGARSSTRISTGREQLLGRGLMAGIELARSEMTPARFGELAALRAAIGRWCAAIFDRYDLLLTPTVPFDPYPAPGPYPTEIEGPAPAVVERRLVHDPVQPVVASGGDGAHRPLAPRPADGHADRRPAPPRRSRPAGGARLRARAAVASALASCGTRRSMTVREENDRWDRHESQRRLPPAGADAVWDLVRDFGGVQRWNPTLSSSEVDRPGVGGVRTLKMGEVTIRERLEKLDEAARTMSYSIVEAPLPVSNYLATVELSALGPKRTQIVWSSTFEPGGMSDEQLKALFEGVYQQAIEGMRRALLG